MNLDQLHVKLVKLVKIYFMEPIDIEATVKKY